MFASFLSGAFRWIEITQTIYIIFAQCGSIHFSKCLRDIIPNKPNVICVGLSYGMTSNIGGSREEHAELTEYILGILKRDDLERQRYEEKGDNNNNFTLPTYGNRGGQITSSNNNINNDPDSCILI